MTAPSATVVADSVSPQGKRLTSFGITAHRFILAEINTHRMLSRSYRSSRAVPSKRLIEEVRTAPAMPVHWGANRPGMQAREELTDQEFDYGTGTGETIAIREHWLRRDPGHDQLCYMAPRIAAEKTWRIAAHKAADAAEEMARIGLHKQIANRVLEPFLWVHGVITATEWDNFFGLRLHEDAQPEFRALANAMWAAMKASTPNPLVPGQWHLPYIDMEDVRASCTSLSENEKDLLTSGKIPADFGEMNRERPGLPGILCKVSVARCARSSYHSFETGKRSTIEEDLATYAKLNIPGTESYDPLRPIHASPAEHQGTPDEYLGECAGPIYKYEEEHGNLVGFRQYRKMLPGEALAPLPSGYIK